MLQKITNLCCMLTLSANLVQAAAEVIPETTPAEKSVSSAVAVSGEVAYTAMIEKFKDLLLTKGQEDLSTIAAFAVLNDAYIQNKQGNVMLRDIIQGLDGAEGGQLTNYFRQAWDDRIKSQVLLHCLRSEGAEGFLTRTAQKIIEDIKENWEKACVGLALADLKLLQQQHQDAESLIKEQLTTDILHSPYNELVTKYTIFFESAFLKLKLADSASDGKEEEKEELTEI